MSSKQDNLAQRYYQALNRLTKWRTVLTGWQLGTRLKGDPESDTVRDHRDVTMCLQVENFALLQILLQKRLVSKEEYDQALLNEQEDGIALHVDDVIALPEDDPTRQAVLEHRGLTILLREQSSALLGLLLDKGIVTVEEFQRAAIVEADRLEEDYQQRFPGIRATDNGLEFDARAAETMKHWKP